VATIAGPRSGRPSIVAMAWAMHEAAGKKAAKGEKAEAAKLAHPKDDLVRSEAYRKLVAMGACMHCGVDGHSQAAHLQPEGKGIKVTDLDTFPLCTVRPDGAGGMYEGCHAQFDGYRLFPREEAARVARKWIRITQKRVHVSGRWPKNAPVPAWLEKQIEKEKPSNEAPPSKGRSGVHAARGGGDAPAPGKARGGSAGGRHKGGAARAAGGKRKR
jgi:hypothetical protein